MSGAVNDEAQNFYLELSKLISDFENLADQKLLRPKVLHLVKVMHAFRNLGIAISPGGGTIGARQRILRYLQQHTGQIIHGDELMVVSGIQEYARRIRELRVEFGWPIVSGLTLSKMIEEEATHVEATDSLRPDNYILLENKQDKQAAFRYNFIRELRSAKLSARDKILQLFRSNVGESITGEELKYVSNISDWPRRVRELRTEYGWPIFTKATGRPDLPIGYYVLSEDKQEPVHDRHISASVRVAVLDRDANSCRKCGWPKSGSTGDTLRHQLELHHITHHQHGGENELDNLMTLCNIHHDEIHRLDPDNDWDKEAVMKWLEN